MTTTQQLSEKPLQVLYHDEAGAGDIAIHIRFNSEQVNGAQELEGLLAAIVSQTAQIVEAVAPGATTHLRITDVMGLQGVLFRGVESRLKNLRRVAGGDSAPPQSLPQSPAAVDRSE